MTLTFGESTETRLSTAELVDLCAIDDDLFARSFFPQAMRQKTPEMHKDLDRVLNDARVRLLNLILPRDFGKTTKLRIFTAKRIAYGISRTILYIAASETKAAQNIQWLKGRVEARLGMDGAYHAPLFSSVFGLAKGGKWTETEMQIQHKLLAQPIWVLGVGITSESIRGINFDDYRPDLIVLDDILTDENGASAEQREKINTLVMAAVKNSLAPVADSPNAKLVMMNTPQNQDDVSSRAEKSQEWTTIRKSCWTPETEEAPVEEQESAWPERHPTETLRFQKREAARLNQLSTFVREKECKIVARELCMFRPDWLHFYDEASTPLMGVTVLAIDPVPPPTPGEEKKKQVMKRDWEVLGVWRLYAGNYYLLEYEMNRGHQPNWTIAKFFELAMRWNPQKVIIETVAYQKVLRWILQQEMTRRQKWYTVQEFNDVRSKPVKINDALSGPASNGKVFVRASHVEFIQQFSDYPNVEHDDVLDMGAMGVIGLSNPWMEALDPKTGKIDSSNVYRIPLRRRCP